MTDKRDVVDANIAGTVIKALDILDCLAEHHRPMTTQEIAKHCGISRPTAYRLLMTLMSRGFIRELNEHRFSLGTRLITLSTLVLDDLDLLQTARPYLHELCLISNETANLSILDGAELLYIGKEESPRSTEMPVSVQMRSMVGTRIKAHSSAMGKAMLAYLSDEQRESFFAPNLPLKAYTKYTITDLNTLMEDLENIRQQGYAIDDREVDEGTRCVAAPVFDNTGVVVAAMSIAGPAYRLTMDHLHELSGEVIRVTQAVSRQLGYVRG